MTTLFALKSRTDCYAWRSAVGIYIVLDKPRSLVAMPIGYGTGSPADPVRYDHDGIIVTVALFPSYDDAKSALLNRPNSLYLAPVPVEDVDGTLWRDHEAYRLEQIKQSQATTIAYGGALNIARLGNEPDNEYEARVIGTLVLRPVIGDAAQAAYERVREHHVTRTQKA